MALGTVVVGGGSGFIGSSLSKALRHIGYNVLIISRQPQLGSISWNELEKDGLPNTCVAAINLAGQNVLDAKRRWTPGFKQNVISSRVRTTEILGESIKRMKNPPKVFATISGVGYYKTNQEDIFTEESPGGDHDFFSRLCSSWENAGSLPSELNVRRVVIRTGIVLGRQGGMIQQIFWPFYLGLGGPIGTGTQYMPWIHISDVVGIFIHIIKNDIKGVLNGVAPELITNKDFSSAFARALWRPAFIPLPPAALKIAFGEERAKMMVDSQKIAPKRTLECGYEFRFPNINSACKDCATLFVRPDK